MMAKKMDKESTGSLAKDAKVNLKLPAVNAAEKSKTFDNGTTSLVAKHDVAVIQNFVPISPKKKQAS